MQLEDRPQRSDNRKPLTNVKPLTREWHGSPIRFMALGLGVALFSASLAVATPSSALAECGEQPAPSVSSSIATSISDTSTELFVGELLDAIADGDPTLSSDCAPPPGDPFQDLDPKYEMGLELGLWKAQASLSGQFDKDFGSGSMFWDGSVAAQFDIGVDDDGSASGSWNFSGDGDIEVTLPEGEMTADQHFEGSGGITGDSHLLSLDAVSVTTGTFTAVIRGFTITNNIDSTPTQNPPHEVRVRAMACGEAYGDWSYSVEQNMENIGFNASFDGFWSAFRDNEAGAELARADYTKGVSTEAKNLFALTSNYILVYNQFVDDFRTWDTPSVFNFMAALEAALNTFRNFSDCDIEFFGQDNVTKAMNALTFLMQGVLTGLVQIPGTLTGDEFRELVHVAVRTSAIGAAAPNPAEAIKAERGLVNAARRMLGEQADLSVGEIDVNADTIEAMRIGSIMNWNYDIGNYRFPARAVYSQYQASLAADGEG